MSARRQSFVTHFLRSFVVLISLFLSSCASSGIVLNDLSTTLKELEISNLPTQKDFPDADAVMVLDLTHNDIDASRRELATFETHHVIKKIFRNTNDQSTVNINVLPDETLESIKARTILPDGRIINLQPSDFYTITGLGESSILYANIQTMRFTFPAAEKDCILEYKYQKRKNRPFVRDVWTLQHDIPVMRNQYGITMPLIMRLLLPWRYKTYPAAISIDPMIDSMQLRRALFDTPVTYTWARRDIPAFKSEEMMPPVNVFRTHLRFALASWMGWGDIAAWYRQEFFQPQFIITDSVRTVAKQLTDSCRTMTQKVRAIYQFVQKLRYVSIQLGESGLRPSTPQTVLEHKYGDCKDKSTLCIALLASIGVKAYPVLALTGDVGRVDPEFVSWDFNHMIVKAELDPFTVYWMDPTDEYAPFGSLPWQVQGVNVLTVNDDFAGRMELTPRSDQNSNLTDISVRAFLMGDSLAHFRVRITSSNEEARHFRAMFSEKGETETKDIFRLMIVNDAVRAQMDSVSIQNLSELDSSLVISMTFHIVNPLQRQGDLLFFNPNLLKMVSDMHWTAKQTRKYPLWFPYSFAIRKNTTIHVLDTSLTIHSFPETVSLQEEAFSFSRLSRSPNPSIIISDETFLMKQAEIPATKYDVAKNFFQNVRLNMEKPVILSRRWQTTHEYAK